MTSTFTNLLAERLAPFNLAPRDVLERDAPGGLGEPGRISANRHCRLFAARDGWIALNLAREEDRSTIPALTGGRGDLAGTIAGFEAAEFRDRAVELQLPVAMVGEAASQHLVASGNAVPNRVVDISALWAGPLCAGLLQRLGAGVIRVESLGRPDPTPQVSPRLDAFLNGGKDRLPLDLTSAEGRRRLLAVVEQADVLVTSARPAALARLGLLPDLFPHVAWVAITAHGFHGSGADRVGFGDDCAAAGGLLQWHNGKPRFLGDALADPLTGVEAALAVLSGCRGVIDMAMARVAASYAAIG